MQTLPPLALSSHGKPVDTFPQAPELEKELKQNIKGEVRFDRGSRAMYSTDGSNYRQVPIGLVVPRDADDVVCGHGRLPQIRSAGVGPRSRYQPGGSVLQCRRGARLHQVHESDPRARPATMLCPGAARGCPRHAPQPGRSSQADLCARSLHPQPLHDRRHDREQLLRHPLSLRWQNGRQHRRAAHLAL